MQARNRLASFLIGSFLIVHVLAAQTTGSIEGTVTDGKGSPLPGVSIEATSPTLQGSRVSITDAGGRYRLPSLPPGVYSLTASLSGISPVKKERVGVTLGATATVPLSMSLSAQESVVVSGESPVIDITKTAIGTSASSETISRLPLGRNYTSIATRAPGTGTDQAGGVTVYGATSLENEYIVDGVNTTGIKLGDQGKNLNGAFVQEVEVKLGGYEAEFGRALGGVINVVTKSGGNDFHGDAFGSYNDKSLASTDKREAPRADVGQGKLIVAKALDAGADLGGFFVKDRLWFFGAYDRLNTDADFEHFVNRDRVEISSGTRADRFNLYAGKLTWKLGESNTLVGSIFGDPSKYNNRSLGIIGPDAANLAQDTFGAADYSAKYNGIFGDQFLAEAQFGYHDEKHDFGAQDPAQNDRIQLIRQQSGKLTEFLPNSGFAGLTLKEQYKRYAYRLTGTAYAGSHELKLGGDYENIQSSYRQHYPGGARVTLRFTASGGDRTAQHRYYGGYPATLNCAQRNDGSRPAAGTFVDLADCAGYVVADSFADPDTRNLAFFGQDAWKVLPNLTVNAGLRYETQKLRNAEGETVIDLKNEISPRFGVVWDPAGNGKSKVYASYGRFYTTIPQDIQTRSLGRENTVIVFNNTRDRSFNPIGLPGQAFPQTGDAIGPGLKGMYQDEIIAGIEYQLFQTWSVGVKGIYKSLDRIVEDRCDLAANPDVFSFGPGSSDPKTKVLAPTCAVINPGGGGILNTLKDPSDRECYPKGELDENGSIVPSSPCQGTGVGRRYRGLELDASHRFSDRFFAQSSYIYSFLNGNYSGNLSQTREGGQFDPNINADFDYPGLLTNAYGLLRNDVTHQLKITGFYSFPFGVTAGANFTYASGRPYSIRGCPVDPVACNAGYSQEGYLVQRGSAGRLPPIYEADLHLEYALRLGGASITPVVDVFNVLNRQGETSREELYNNQATIAGNAPCPDGTYKNDCGDGIHHSPNPNFGKAIAWQAPRQFRVGAPISF